MGNWIPFPFFIAFMVLLVGYSCFLLAFPVWHWSRIRDAAHCFAWGAFVAFGAFTCITVVEAYTSPRVPVGDVIQVYLIGMPATGLVYCILWRTTVFCQRTVHQRVVVRQDGTLCPKCAYSLIGNESTVCPECGTPYTFGDLGVTAEEFVALSESRRAGGEW
jgi:hypothetical protein